MVCDSKTDKSTASLMRGDQKHTIVEGAIALRLLKVLNDKVDKLTTQVDLLTRQTSAPQRK
jgi:hypothetical protein